MGTTANEATLSADLLPMDSTTIKKKKKSKKKSVAATTVTDFIPQQQLGATAKICSDMPQTLLLTFSQAIKEHTYHLGEEDGYFEASREVEQDSYQQGYNTAIAKLMAAGNQLDGDDTEDMEADDAFKHGREAEYQDGLEEGQLEAGKGALEHFFEGCSGGRKDGAAKEKERWIVAGHVELGIC
ncbi:hypothetical protein EDD18DRAFT_1356196 [Armillaria luteobubalina]|uniref:Uncharacterized protein n=1 Tax=Armillaria luteobubalina TaxID=153913 RepID=A0AA39UM36_9AGAR|nr:hypothetical protein EDD18DRAFT_1356196 [Armillaria luteobubalina]